MTVSFEDWEKLDLRVCTIKEVKQHPNADKLYILLLDMGNGVEKELVAGLKGSYNEDELINKKVIVCVNLEPKVIRGIPSEGMILAAVDESNPTSILTIDREVDNGAKVR